MAARGKRNSSTPRLRYQCRRTQAVRIDSNLAEFKKAAKGRAWGWAVFSSVHRTRRDWATGTRQTLGIGSGGLGRYAGHQLCACRHAGKLFHCLERVCQGHGVFWPLQQGFMINLVVDDLDAALNARRAGRRRGACPSAKTPILAALAGSWTRTATAWSCGSRQRNCRRTLRERVTEASRLEGAPG